MDFSEKIIRFNFTVFQKLIKVLPAVKSTSKFIAFPLITGHGGSSHPAILTARGKGFPSPEIF